MGMEHINKGAQMALQAFGITDQAKQRAMMEKLTGAQIGQIEDKAGKEKEAAGRLSAFTEEAKGLTDPAEIGRSAMQHGFVSEGAGLLGKTIEKSKPPAPANTLEGVLARKIQSGEIKWDEAVKMKNSLGSDKKATTAFGRFLEINPEPSIKDMQQFAEGMRAPDKEATLRELDIVAKAVGVDLKGDITSEQSKAIIDKLVEMRKWSFMGALMGLQGGGGPTLTTGTAPAKPTVKLDGIIK